MHVKGRFRRELIRLIVCMNAADGGVRSQKAEGEEDEDDDAEIIGGVSIDGGEVDVADVRGTGKCDVDVNS